MRRGISSLSASMLRVDLPSIVGITICSCLGNAFVAHHNQ